MLQCVVPGHVVLAVCCCLSLPHHCCGNMWTGVYLVWLARPSHLYTEAGKGRSGQTAVTISSHLYWHYQTHASCLLISHTSGER